MKIYAIMLVKDEVDVVGYVLKQAEKWADKIFILDNGSTDGTWELIQSMKNEIITPWKQYFGDYHNGLRALVYNEFKHLSVPGDWWCYKLDADEVYAEDPKEFLKKIPKKYQWVAKRSIDYVITKQDIEEYTFSDNFEENIKYLKYFRIPCWSEGRFFRYRKGLNWEPKWQSHYPEHVGVMANTYITTKHYNKRSPKQLQQRIDSRNATKVKQEGSAWKWDKTNWNDFLEDRHDLGYDDGNIETLKKQPVHFGNFKQTKLKAFIKNLLIFLKLYN